jgi:hypothetical protein
MTEHTAEHTAEHMTERTAEYTAERTAERIHRSPSIPLSIGSHGVLGRSNAYNCKYRVLVRSWAF